MWTVRLIAKVTHEQGLLVEQLHVHIDVVDIVKRQVVHFDVGVYTQPVLHDLVDFFFGFSRHAVLVARVVFLQDQFRGEGSAKAIGHPVAAGIHQVGGGFCDAVEIQAQVIGDDLRRGVVVGTGGAVVDPVHHDQVVYFGAVHGVARVIAHPHAVYLVHLDEGDVVQVVNDVAGTRGAEQIGFGVEAFS